jgi:hypothetical protein
LKRLKGKTAKRPMGKGSRYRFQDPGLRPQMWNLNDESNDQVME